MVWDPALAKDPVAEAGPVSAIRTSQRFLPSSSLSFQLKKAHDHLREPVQTGVVSWNCSSPHSLRYETCVEDSSLQIKYLPSAVLFHNYELMILESQIRNEGLLTKGGCQIVVVCPEAGRMLFLGEAFPLCAEIFN